MFLTLLRERNIAFPSALPFTLHPVAKRRSFLPTESRIIARVSPSSRTNLPSDIALWPCFVFFSVLSPQSLRLSVFRLPDEGRKIP